MTYADIEPVDSSMASTIGSSLQQMALSFGLACGSLVAAWYLGALPQSDQLAVTSALHHAFLTLGVVTMLSSIFFWTLKMRTVKTSRRALLQIRSRSSFAASEMALSAYSQ
jgi:hypothetical protein